MTPRGTDLLGTYVYAARVTEALVNYLKILVVGYHRESQKKRYR